ncbi:FimV/HubP family polar landmark protein [Zoogloea sp.]|uniref:FimV/HubP family polar landmark protein n=1 Tax=Zoogloea sp. TaxID=49181 RepID=UPI002620F830|nr:FimV/HubP family polar landmark protein [Zoogloea sp.]MDD3353238.1 hypothetical protein [Zoogloea sp.]
MSGLGQPLRAEVEIAATPEELQNMTARLASADAFRQAGVDFVPSIAGLRMSVERRGAKAVVRVSSDRPINDPFVDMLIELNWSAGRLIREYTFLLDPPDTVSSRVQTPVNSPEVRAPAAAAPVDVQPQRRPASVRVPRTQAGAAGRGYLVQPGDTLHRIAVESRPDGVSVEQMLIALYQGNRSAFIAQDINRLQAGRILRIPDADTVRQLAGDGERRQLVAQSSDFGRYRQRLAEQSGAASAREDVPRQAGGGRIGAKIEDRALVQGSTDQLKVSRAEEGPRGGAGGEKSAARLQALEEDLVSRDKALRDANDRLAELEKSIKELQRLVELKSQGMAALQADGAAPLPATTDQAPVPVPEVKPEAEGGTDAAPPALVDPAKPAEAPGQPPAPAAAPVVAPELPPQPEVGPSEDMSLLLGGGGILALLLGWGAYKIYQRRRTEEAPLNSIVPSEFVDGGNSVFGSAGGQSVDTGSSSIQTDFSQSGLSSIDTDEGVDPVAEADVYMAYGRDAQAEEILLDALKTDPGRTGVHLKLLEIYAQRKNLKQFETTATELYSLTGGNGPDWDKAAALGRKVDPDSPLYRVPAPLTATASAVAKAQPAPPSSMGAAAVAPPAAAFVQAADSYSSKAGPDAERAGDPLESPSQLKDTWALPGELNQYSGMDDIDRAVAAQGEALPLADIPDTSVLDFDLDLQPEPVPSAATVTASTGGVGSGESVGALDFDLGFDQPAPGGGTLVTGGQVSHDFEATATRPQFVGDDFSLPDPSDLDFEVSSEFGERHASLPAEPTVDVDLTATLADDSFLSATDPRPTLDLEGTSFDSSLLDFDFELDDKAPAKEVSVLQAAVDFKPVDLESSQLLSGGMLDLPDAGPPTEPPLDLELQQEVATKLELAKAYEEMGDQDGARELVEEVLREGSPAQQAEAQTMLIRLS